MYWCLVVFTSEWRGSGMTSFVECPLKSEMELGECDVPYYFNLSSGCKVGFC